MTTTKIITDQLEENTFEMLQSIRYTNRKGRVYQSKIIVFDTMEAAKKAAAAEVEDSLTTTFDGSFAFHNVNGKEYFQPLFS